MHQLPSRSGTHSFSFKHTYSKHLTHVYLTLHWWKETHQDTKAAISCQVTALYSGILMLFLSREICFLAFQINFSTQFFTIELLRFDSDGLASSAFGNWWIFCYQTSLYLRWKHLGLTWFHPHLSLLKWFRASFFLLFFFSCSLSTRKCCCCCSLHNPYSSTQYNTIT